jgi:membrane-associated phospholipid phosphatase
LRRALTFGLAVALGGAFPGSGAALAQQRASLRFKVGLWPDGAAIATSLAAASVPLLWPNGFARATCAPCDPAALWPLDRGTVGPMRPAADALSYATLGIEAALGTVFLARARRGEGAAAFVEDATVIAEAVSLTEAVTEWSKVLVHRPRPYLYVPTASGTPTADDGRSFPSSHASVAFAAAAAYASILHRRGLAGSNKLQIGLLFGAATATAVLRVLAHQHFPTDVAAGAAIGLVVGWTVPSLHAVLP